MRAARHAAIAAWRLVAALLRPSAAANRRRLRARGESLSALVIRDATAADIPALPQANRSDDPAFAGELRKIYLLRDYQRLGLGRRLVAGVARRFLERGIGSMWLWADARNPSQAAWRALGAERRDDDPGSGNWGWPDISALATMDDRAERLA